MITLQRSWHWKAQLALHLPLVRLTGENKADGPALALSWPLGTVEGSTRLPACLVSSLTSLLQPVSPGKNARGSSGWMRGSAGRAFFKLQKRSPQTLPPEKRTMFIKGSKSIVWNIICGYKIFIRM